MRTTRPLRIAARPPLTLLAPRRTAAPYTHGLNDEYLLQGCTSIFLKRQGGDWYSHLLTTKSRQTNECRALHAHLDMPLTIADLARSARPETSRFPMTRTAPRLAPTTSAQRTPELRTRCDMFFLRRVFPKREFRKIVAGLQTLIFNDFCGILIDTRNPLTY
jgi:hypothetical protein